MGEREEQLKTAFLEMFPDVEKAEETVEAFLKIAEEAVGEFSEGFLSDFRNTLEKVGEDIVNGDSVITHMETFMKKREEGINNIIRKLFSGCLEIVKDRKPKDIYSWGVFVGIFVEATTKKVKDFATKAMLDETRRARGEINL